MQQNNRPLVVFILIRIFRNSHREIFSIDNLINSGYEVKMLSFCKLVGYNSTVTDPFLMELSQEISSIEELKKNISTFSGRNILFVTNYGYINSYPEYFKIIRQAYPGRLLGYHTKVFPGVLKFTNVENFLRKNQNNKLIAGVAKIFFKIKNKKEILPDYFLSSTSYLVPFNIRYTFSVDKLFLLNSDDVNKIKEESVNKKVFDGKYGVFLDQVIPFAHIKKFKEDYIPIYYDRLNKALLEFKKKYGLETIYIAAHPESASYKKEIPYNLVDFEFVDGQTINLIKDAEIVFAHYSTSVGIAVYFKKNLIFMSDDRLRSNSKLNYCIYNLANLLGSPVVNIDNVTPTEFTIKMMNINEVKYDSYIKNFLEEKPTSDHAFEYAINSILEA